MNKLTILTPSYNRAQTLPKLYESLKRQTVSEPLLLKVSYVKINIHRNIVLWILCGRINMDELRQILSEIRPDIDFDAQKRLIDDGLLDSFDIISIVGEVNSAFAIEINVEDLLPENFNSIEAMYELICKLQDE